MQKNLHDYTHIIWDWNGTLLNDAHICVEINNNLLEKYSLPPVSPTHYEDIFTFPVKNYYQALGFDFSKRPFEHYSNEFIKDYEVQKYNAPLQDNAKKILQHFKDVGTKQSIISASQQDSLSQMVENHKLKDMFVTWRGLDNHHAASKIDIGKQWVQEYIKENDKLIMIGDTIHDLELAQAIGADAILIYSGHQSLERLKKAHPYVINNLLELI